MEVGDIGGVMLVVVNLHRTGVDRGLKGVKRIGQGGQCIGHDNTSPEAILRDNRDA